MERGKRGMVGNRGREDGDDEEMEGEWDGERIGKRGEKVTERGTGSWQGAERGGERTRGNETGGNGERVCSWGEAAMGSRRKWMERG